MQINLDDIKMFGKLYAYNAIKFYGNKEILSQNVTAKVISDAEKKVFVGKYSQKQVCN